MASVPGRYAGALFELANESGALPTVEADLEKFQAVYDESEDFRRLVKSPVFSAEDQQRAVASVLSASGIGALTANFFGLVARNRRLFVAPEMVKAFKALAADARGEVAAEVTSASPLSDDQVSSLKEALKASIGKDVGLDARVDPTILGGLIVKFGSRMIDSSLKSKLANMKSELKAVN